MTEPAMNAPAGWRAEILIHLPPPQPSPAAQGRGLKLPSPAQRGREGTRAEGRGEGGGTWVKIFAGAVRTDYLME